MVCKLVNEWSNQIHAAVDYVQRAPRSGGVWWKVVVKFGIEIEFVLHEAGEVRTQDAGFVGRSARAVVANSWVFA